MGTGGGKPRNSYPTIRNDTISTVYALNSNFSDFVILFSKLNYEGSTMLIDTQAGISLIKISSINNTFDVSKRININDVINIKGVTDETISSLGSICVDFHVDNEIVPALLHVVPDDFDIPADGIIGKDFLHYYKCSIDLNEMSLKINLNGYVLPIPLLEGPEDGVMVLPARSEVVRSFKLSTVGDVLVLDQEISPGVLIPRTIVSSSNPLIRILNVNNSYKTVERNCVIETEPLSNYDVIDPNCLHSGENRKKSLFEKLKKNTNPMYRSKMQRLWDKYPDIFTLESDKLTVNNFYEQELRIADKEPVYIKNYRLPHSQKEEIDKQIKKFLDSDLIEPSRSNYNSPIILVPKPPLNGEKRWRLCIDYRMVNKKLIADKFPLPRIESILDNLGRAKFFSILDLYGGFHQVPLQESSRDITSFSTDSGSYRWKVLPFGLNVSPNSFSRMMSLAFSGVSPLQWFLYIDDIVVVGCSEKHHMKNLESAFQICKQYNLKLHPDKCKFFKTEVTYLGHLCTDHGIYPDPSKTEVVQNYPVPLDKDAVKRFVAFMNYYRKFIPNFAALAKPLNNLGRRHTDFIWTQECQLSFDKLKQSLLNPLVLQYPDFAKEFILTVDASKYAVGAVLSQNHNDHDLPVSFASRGFTQGEMNKANIEKELAAIHFGITHYRPYLYGYHFHVRSDHKPLTYLFSLRNPSSKLTRMRLDLEEYNFSIGYIKGKDNVVADALSRITIEELKLLSEHTTQVNVMTRSMKRNINNNKCHNENTENDKNIENDLNLQVYNGNNDRNKPLLKFDIEK